MSMPGVAGSADGNRVRVPFQPEWNRTGPYSVEFWAKPGQNAALASPGASVEFIASVPVADLPGRPGTGNREWLGISAIQLDRLGCRNFGKRPDADQY
jgi:hypothetical protein